MIRCSGLAALLAAASFGAFALAAPAMALACPSCPAGVTARKQVIDDDLPTHLVVALAPFLVAGLVSRFTERIGTERDAPPEEGEP